MEFTQNFDELRFFAEVKRRPGIFFGCPSLLSLRDHLFGMGYAFSVCNCGDKLKYFHLFIDWYHETVLHDSNDYACWWNHILYTSGNDDVQAFGQFFRVFEHYLKETYDLCLPEVG